MFMVKAALMALAIVVAIVVPTMGLSYGIYKLFEG